MPELRWLFFPNFQASNPYQSLLAAELSRRVAVHPGTIMDALESVAERPTVFHVHWEDAIFPSRGAGEGDAWTSLEGFLAQLSVFRELGGIVVWTMHNASPHEDRFPAASAHLREVLARCSHLVHVHGQFARGIARGAGAPDDRIVSVPHPDMACAYPNDITREAARRYFGLGPDPTVFSFMGAMRPYKGIDLLLRAFAKLRLTQPAAQLILAGRHTTSPEGRYCVISPGVRLIPRFIDDGMVQYVLNAADYVVLPYRRILTSGAVALALGFARPVIVPDLSPLLDVVQPGREALVFHAGDEDDLCRIMSEACEQPPEDRLDLQKRAWQSAQATSFADLAGALLDRIMPPQRMADNRPLVTAGR